MKLVKLNRQMVIGLVGLLGFLLGLYGLWVFLKEKYSFEAPPIYSSVARFERDGVPKIQAKDVLDRSFDLHARPEPLVIVNFWASWCAPCVEEFPSMLKLIKEMKGRVLVVAVSMDDEEKDLRAFLKIFKVPQPGFEVIWDQDKSIGRAYDVGKLPETFIVGADRKLRRKVLGIEDWASPNAMAYFESLIAEGKAAPSP